MIYSFERFGYEGSLVNIEVDLRRGIPAVDIVGIGDGYVTELCECVRSAIRNSGKEFPPERVLISLSPADILKRDGSHELAVALAVLAAKDDFPRSQDTSVLVYGGLKLSGEAEVIPGTFAALTSAKAWGIKYAIVPEDCDIKELDGMAIIRVKNLTEAYDKLCALEEYETYEAPEKESEITFSDFEGESLDSLENTKAMAGMKYAMAVAAAGRLNLIAIGGPGCGKTMSLQKLPEITPELMPEEASSTTRIWSLAGLMLYEQNYLKKRPFRIPHQTASIEGICGGGPNCRPGEISLAHKGILFLDEAAEFRSSVLQMLRVPLENKSITLSRAGRTTVYPADFQLVMATNPCPCGNYGAKDKVCLCSANSIEQYWKKFSAPLLDRIEIRYNFNNPDNYTDDIGLSVHDIRDMVKRAWEIQYRRQGKLNRDLDFAELNDVAHLSDNAVKKLNNAKDENDLSARSVTSILRIARTIADMKGLDNVDEKCVTHALELHVTFYHTLSI